MWTVYSKDLETNKITWECGFGWDALRLIDALLTNKYVELLSIERMEFSWKNFISCFFCYSGTIDIESIEAEGKVE